MPDNQQRIERIVAVAKDNGYTLSATKRVAEQNLGGQLTALEMHQLESLYYQGNDYANTVQTPRT